MTRKLLKNLIEQRFDFERIYPQIQNQRRGVLYRAINLMINSLEEDQSKVGEVCNFFEIKESSNIEDDFGIAYDNIAKIYIDIIKKSLRIDKIDIFGILSKLEKPAFTTFCSTLEDEQQMEVIVFTAFILIAGFGLVMRKSSTQNQPQDKLLEDKVTRALPNQSVPTAICLVVPASAVSGLTKETEIDRNGIIQLIDAASDFLCIKVEEAEKLSIDIDINQNPSPDSQLKFYIRIDIPDGQDIISGETRYVIKRDLPLNKQGKIKELGRLISVSSISSFNRI